MRFGCAMNCHEFRQIWVSWEDHDRPEVRRAAPRGILKIKTNGPRRGASNTSTGPAVPDTSGSAPYG
jgi:hypothetical protein